ncbi:hypothetical protein WMY93_002665 [Mugilogobius chulae]|uniref:Uncharacterized protein n=1 Tax=Mugilogobius chulae TaxID=88201 RepID=A0AAW0PX88_9GOBI
MEEKEEVEKREAHTNMAEGEEYDPSELIEDVTNVTDIAANVLDAGDTLGQLISKFVPKYRQCSVQIDNKSSDYILRNPRVHMDTGVCAEPLTPSISPSSKGKGLFIKSPRAMRGSGAVFTYDLYHSRRHECVAKLAALFKVPYDLNLKSVVFAVGLFGRDTECDKHLFKDMFSSKQDKFVRAKANGSGITVQDDIVNISSSMSNCAKAVFEIEISDTTLRSIFGDRYFHRSINQK